MVEVVKKILMFIVAIGVNLVGIPMFYTISFTLPFPTAPCSTALDTCIQLCADLEDLPCMRCDTQRDQLIDAIIGKLMRVSIALRALINEADNGCIPQWEDLDLLSLALDRLKERYAQQLACSEDAIIKELFMHVVEHGAQVCTLK